MDEKIQASNATHSRAKNAKELLAAKYANLGTGGNRNLLAMRRSGANTKEPPASSPNASDLPTHASLSQVVEAATAAAAAGPSGTGHSDKNATTPGSTAGGVAGGTGMSSTMSTWRKVSNSLSKVVNLQLGSTPTGPESPGSSTALSPTNQDHQDGSSNKASHAADDDTGDSQDAVGNHPQAKSSAGSGSRRWGTVRQAFNPDTPTDENGDAGRRKRAGTFTALLNPPTPKMPARTASTQPQESTSTPVTQINAPPPPRSATSPPPPDGSPMSQTEELDPLGRLRGPSTSSKRVGGLLDNLKQTFAPGKELAVGGTDTRPGRSTSVLPTPGPLKPEPRKARRRASQPNDPTNTSPLSDDDRLLLDAMTLAPGSTSTQRGRQVMSKQPGLEAAQLTEALRASLRSPPLPGDVSLFPETGPQSRRGSGARVFDHGPLASALTELQHTPSGHARMAPTSKHSPTASPTGSPPPTIPTPAHSSMNTTRDRSLMSSNVSGIHDARWEAMEAAVDLMERKLGHVGDEFGLLERDYDTLKYDAKEAINTLEARLELVTGKVERLEATKAQLNRKLTGVTQRLEESSLAVDSYADKVKRLEDQVQALQRAHASPFTASLLSSAAWIVQILVTIIVGPVLTLASTYKVLKTALGGSEGDQGAGDETGLPLDLFGDGKFDRLRQFLTPPNGPQANSLSSPTKRPSGVADSPRSSGRYANETPPKSSQAGGRPPVSTTFPEKSEGQHSLFPAPDTPGTPASGNLDVPSFPFPPGRTSSPNTSSSTLDLSSALPGGLSDSFAPRLNASTSSPSKPSHSSSFLAAAKPAASNRSPRSVSTVSPNTTAASTDNVLSSLMSRFDVFDEEAKEEAFVQATDRSPGSVLRHRPGASRQ